MMRTMYATALLMLAAVHVCSAQRDTTFAVLSSIGAGYGVNISQEILLPKQAVNNGFAGSLRFLWKPDHRLRVGVETGWLHLTSAEGVLRDSGGVVDRGRFELASIPMLVLFSMNFNHVNISAGAGYYLTLSYLLGRGQGVSSTQLDYGIAVSAEYMFPLSEQFGVGAGINLYGITELGQYIAALQFRVQYRLVEF